jgi:trypsin
MGRLQFARRLVARRLVSKLNTLFLFTLFSWFIFCEGTKEPSVYHIALNQYNHDKTSSLRRRDSNFRIDIEEPESHRNLQNSNATWARIYGGIEVPIRRYPYLAALFWTNPVTGNLRLVCGGSLIAPTVILTAAHCADKVDVVMLGIYNFTNIQEMDYEYYMISPNQKVMYPSYDPTTQAGDFLLLTLDQPSKFYPITLNTDDLLPSDSQLLTVMGWGVTESGTQSSTPREAVVSAMANSLCAERYRHSSPIYDNELCASGGSTYDSCQGDSGGPLILKGGSAQEDILVASVSWGYDCADSLYPGVYARLSAVRAWLKELVPQARFDSSTF